MVFRKKVWRRRASFSLGCFALIGVVVLSAETLVARRKKNPCSDLYKPRSVLNLITFVRENKVDAELLRTIPWNNFAQLGNFDKILSRANSWIVVEVEVCLGVFATLNLRGILAIPAYLHDIILFTARHLWNLINVQSYFVLTKDFNGNGSKYLI